MFELEAVRKLETQGLAKPRNLAQASLATSDFASLPMRQWMHRAITLIETAAVQLGDQQLRAQRTLLEAALLLRQQFSDSNRVDWASAGCRALSIRESSILRMIAHGMSNKRIAQSLGIAPETVKSHAKNIFVKLATRTRAQAVARAESIGFL